MEQKGDFKEQEAVYCFKGRSFDMRIAICDDDEMLINELKPVLYQYANAHRFELIIDEFHSGETLLDSSILYDMIILDFQMDGINGLEAARILRKKHVNCSIIFLTGYPHFIYEAFEVNTFRFLKKPVDYDKLLDAFDDYFMMFGNDYPILLQHNREVITLNTKDVVYLEAMNKHCMIHLFKRDVFCAKTMAVIGRMMPTSHFYKVNRAFIVNFNFIEVYNADIVKFTNGHNVHISRKYMTEFKAAYRDYSNLKNPKRLETQ